MFGFLTRFALAFNQALRENELAMERLVNLRPLRQSDVRGRNEIPHHHNNGRQTTPTTGSLRSPDLDSTQQTRRSKGA